MLLADRVVLVTGIGPGLGRSIALQCATHGADVVLAARTQATLDGVADEVRAMGRRALPVAADVTSDDSVAALLDRVAADWGRLDGVVNSAFQQPPIETVEAASMSTWLASFEINCHAGVRVTKAALPLLRAVDGHDASVVFVNTMSIWTNRAGFGAYAAAKAATWSVARTLAGELGPDGIRVNSIAPGYIWGDPVAGYLQLQADRRGVDASVVRDELLAQIPLRRVNTPDEIAGAAVFLLSDLARGMTGAFLDVNGGQAIH